MTQGWVSIYRSIQDTDHWKEKPYSRGQAWVDLILLANHDEGSFRVRGVVVKIKRGQVGVSEVKLAEKWGWSRGKLRRFINELKTVHQIEQQKNNVTSVITIVNYDKYQNPDSKKDSKQNSKQYTNNNGNNGNKKATTFPPDSIEFGLAQKCFDIILSRKPDYKKPNLQSWAKEVDKMIRLDGRSPARIEALFRWCQQDDFEQSNVLSTSKLRQRFDALEMKMDKHQPSVPAPEPEDDDGWNPTEKQKDAFAQGMEDIRAERERQKADAERKRTEAPW